MNADTVHLNPVRPPGEAARKQRAAIIEKSHDALQLRRMGASYPEIAKTLHISRATAIRYVKHGLKQLYQEPGEAVIKMELDRLDALMSAVWPAAMKGDLNALDRVLRIMERRARYLNLDSPFRKELLETEAERLAVLHGLDKAELIREAEQVLKAARA